MKHQVTRFKNLGIALKELERFVRHGRHLQSGKPFARLKMRSREALANWLLCVAGNYAYGANRFTFSSDPNGGDGLITDAITGETVSTEHVFVVGPHPGSDDPQPQDVEAQIQQQIEKKQQKGSAAYASGKTLVVFSNAVGWWNPNNLAKRLSEPLDFDAVWVVALNGVQNGEYAYNVTRLDLRRGNAPVWRVTIAPDFTSWRVEPVQ